MEIKIKEVFGSAVLFLIAVILLPLASCGPMVMTTGVSEPLPPWFYPNRLEVVPIFIWMGAFGLDERFYLHAIAI